MWTFEVYEDRSARGSQDQSERTRLSSDRQQSSTGSYVYFAGGRVLQLRKMLSLWSAFANIRWQRDLLFIDQRVPVTRTHSTVRSLIKRILQSYLRHFFPSMTYGNVANNLNQKPIQALHTSIAADDLDDVRAALGYERLNLFGGSYGTRAALVYLKRHPKHVRTVTLQGVAPTNQYMPRDFAQQSERALQGVLAECAADEPCNAAFPELKAEAKALLAQLLKGPVEVEVRNPNAAPESTERTKVRLSRDLAAEAIRYMLYNPVAASRIPLVIHLAARDDFVPLAQSALRYRMNLVATGSNGMYLSVTCAEDLPWIKPGEGEQLAANTFLGDYRLRQQREACAFWPRATIESDYAAPIKSNIPVLILTGEWDPVTAPSNGDGVARTLSNSLHIVVPHGAHGFGGLAGGECIERVSRSLLSEALSQSCTSCVKSITRKGFALR